LTNNTIDVVQFEIVTPDGEVRKANAYKNKDLFWALRGGGPGFGVRCLYSSFGTVPSTFT
jgi:hypothetical protein